MGRSSWGLRWRRERQGNAAALYGAVAIGIMRKPGAQKIANPRNAEQMNQLVASGASRGGS